MSAAATLSADRAASRRELRRWLQLVASVFVMMALAGVQYAWPVLSTGPGVGVRTSLTAMQDALAAYVILEAVFVPLEGFLADRLGRPVLLVAGGAVVAAGLLGAGRAESLRALVAFSALGGVGAALVYGATVGKALRCFPDRRVACVGVTAGASAAVAALAPWTLAAAARFPGGFPALLLLGAAEGAVIVVAALFVVDPPGPSDSAPCG
jgi:OFA family oxalate/formate antiporter-like MFS transporter